MGLKVNAIDASKRPRSGAQNMLAAVFVRGFQKASLGGGEYLVHNAIRLALFA